MTPRRALWILIVASALGRLVLAASLGPGNDEAYHYLFAVHPAWSYYDHPPMMAVVEAAGLSLAHFQAAVVPLRLGFIVLFAGTTFLMARLTGRFFGAWAGVYAAFALNVTAYYGAIAGTCALPDGPLAFFWLLTLDRLVSAFEAPDQIRRWIAVGLAWSGALLSKYHAVFLPVGALLYICLEPTARKVARLPGPYFAVVLGVLGFSPVIAWNATHGWASFAFQSGRAAGLTFRPDALVGAIAGAMVYLLPWIWIFVVRALFRTVRSWSLASAGERFLVCQSLPLLTVFLAIACVRPLLPHWTLIGLLSGFPLLGRDWAALSVSSPIRMRQRAKLCVGVLLLIATVIVAQTRTGLITRLSGGRLRASGDASSDMYGWDQVAQEMERRRLIGQPGTFLFTGKWYHSGQLAFATKGKSPVLCYNPNVPHHFAYWSSEQEWVGHDGILVAVNHSSTEPEIYERWFERIEPAGEFRVKRGGATIREVRFFRCIRQTKPFPFNHPAPGPVDLGASVAGETEKKDARVR
jgi:Dolichyl-phosphate-mannose-protein mannosyltransferase